jgi:hypothetical protein
MYRSCAPERDSPHRALQKLARVSNDCSARTCIASAAGRLRPSGLLGSWVLFGPFITGHSPVVSNE